MKARPPGRESSSPDNINTRGPPGSVIKLSSDQIRQFPVATRAMRIVFDKTAQKGVWGLRSRLIRKRQN